MLLHYSRLFAGRPRETEAATRAFGAGADPLEWMEEAGVSTARTDRPRPESRPDETLRRPTLARHAGARA